MPDYNGCAPQKICCASPRLDLEISGQKSHYCHSLKIRLPRIRITKSTRDTSYGHKAASGMSAGHTPPATAYGPIVIPIRQRRVRRSYEGLGPETAGPLGKTSF